MQRFEIDKNHQNLWHWRLRASNGEPIASGELYYNRRDCERAIDLVKSTNQDTEVRDLTVARGLLGIHR